MKTKPRKADPVAPKYVKGSLWNRYLKLRQTMPFWLTATALSFFVIPVVALVLINVHVFSNGPMVNITGTENYQMVTEVNHPALWTILGWSVGAIIVISVVGNSWYHTYMLFPASIVFGVTVMIVVVVNGVTTGNPDNRGLPANALVFQSQEQLDQKTKFTPQTTDSADSRTPMFIKTTYREVGMLARPTAVQYEYVGTLEETRN